MNTKLAYAALAVIAAALITTFTMTTPNQPASTRGWQHAALTGPMPASKSPGDGGVEVDGADSQTSGGIGPEYPPPDDESSSTNGTGNGCIDSNTDAPCPTQGPGAA